MYQIWYVVFILILKIDRAGMPGKVAKILEVHFYAEISGNEPVREWILQLDGKDGKIIGQDILTVQYSWPIVMPLVKPLGQGLWEVRSNLDNRIARTVFIIQTGKMILLHGFIKKTQKVSAQDIEIAEKRSREYKRRSK
jgi:phage-related protein